jgi:predicted enzyme related to lactoylglutathione lyase
MPRPVVHWEIASSDAQRLQRFYSELFDWEVDADNPLGYGLIKTGESRVQGGIVQARHGVPRYLTFYVHVEALEPYLSRVEALGGEIVVAHSHIPDVGTFAMFKDPDGNLVGMFEE